MPDAPFVTPPAPWTTVWPALPALIMALVGGWGLRRRAQPDRYLWAILGVALVVRVLWIPAWEHEYDGHEAEYLDLLLGQRELTRGGPMLYPAMQWLYRGLGLVAPHPIAPLALNVLAALAGVGAAAGLIGRLSTPQVGRAAALALALWGNLAFWATSAYNVTLPHTLGLFALWALAVWIRGDAPWAAGLLAGGAGALAVATRVEAWLLAPVGLALVILGRPRGAARALPGILLGAGLAAYASWLVLFPGTTPGAGQRALSFAINRLNFAYFAPFDSWWSAPIPLVGLGLGLARWPRLFAPMAIWVLTTHLVFASFDDYGFRHTLGALVGLAACLGALTRARWGRPLAAAGAALLLLHTHDVAGRYYADEDAFAASLDPALPRVGVEALADCALICEDGRIVPEAQQRSHFNLWDPAEAERLRAERGCLRWVFGVQDYRWSSRAVRDRALRLMALYETRPEAALTLEPGRPVGLVYAVGERTSARGKARAP